MNGKLLRYVLLAVCLLSAAYLPAAAEEGRGLMNFETSDQISQAVIQNNCGGPTRGIILLKSASGRIGGYVIQPLIMDAPIRYLDCNGKFLAFFHIFGSATEKAEAAKIIDALRREFPIEEWLDCAKPLPQ